MLSQGSLLRSSLALVRIDFAPSSTQPRASRVLLATVIALAGSLAADALLVVIGTTIFPATRGYVHFRFPDYGRLTTIGVLIACAGWPIVNRVSSAPRWVFFRSAILVTLALWLPDLYLFYRGQPPRAVAVLMVMHLAIALITYNVLVHVAPSTGGHATPVGRHRLRGPRPAATPATA